MWQVANSRLTTFCELTKTISKLFDKFAVASKSLAIWVNKKESDGELTEERLKKMLKKAAKEKTNEVG